MRAPRGAIGLPPAPPLPRASTDRANLRSAPGPHRDLRDDEPVAAGLGVDGGRWVGPPGGAGGRDAEIVAAETDLQDQRLLRSHAARDLARAHGPAAHFFRR